MVYNILNSLFLLVVCATICECQRPNFVIILTDDQDDILGGMKPMENVEKFIRNKGVKFTNTYTSSPICCPSRASFLTGKYPHNHGTLNNSFTGGCNGPAWYSYEERRTFANVLYKDGYHTFYAGKYLNEYGKEHTGGPERVPPGWAQWHGLVGNSVYYNYTLSNNGVPTRSYNLYLTDIIRDLALNYIAKQTAYSPFLMVLAPPAPHEPFTPAPRHRERFANVTAPRGPNFNFPAKDKHWLMTLPPSPLAASALPTLDAVFRARWQALLAVDEMVADVVKALDAKAFLNNTYVIYTSDNGYHLGQFAQVLDKRQPYETDIKVPLLVRGPKIKPNSWNHQPIVNIDLAPTILKLAGLKPLRDMDGRPINFQYKFLIDERIFLIEYHGEGDGDTVDSDCPWIYDANNLAHCRSSYECKCQDSRNNTYACVRHIADRINMKFCFFTDDSSFAEVYNVYKDPYEMDNIVDEMFPSVRHWYQMTLLHMIGCKGAQECDRPMPFI